MPSLLRDGTTVAYEVSGRGDPIILGSSFLMNREMWRPQIDRLARRYHVIAVDWRGHGRSGPVRKSVTLDDLADDLRAVLDAEDIDNAIWCGLSLGGMVAMREAIRNPARVTALILLDTDAGQWNRGERLKFGLLGVVARLAGMRAVTPSVQRTFFSRYTRQGRPDLIAYWRRSMRDLSVPSVYRMLQALARRPSMAGQVTAISVPTLIIHGADDAAIPCSRAQELHRSISGSRLRIIPDCGHIATLDQPDIVSDEIEQFLQSLPPPVSHPRSEREVGALSDDHHDEV